MARKKNDEKEQEKLRFSFDALSDEEIDLRILPQVRLIQEANGSRQWTEENKNLRNYAVWRLLYKQGKSRVATARALVDRWGVSQQTAYEYIRNAENEVNATYDETVEEIRAKNMEKAQTLYDMAMANNQPKVAMQALEILNKLKGLYENKTTLTVNDVRFEFD